MKYFNFLRKKITHVLLLSTVVCTSVHAQFPTAASYPFTASSKTFNYLTGGTPLSFSSWDDGYVTGVPIGFTFTFCNVNYTTVTAQTNGFMNFGNVANYTYPSSVSGLSTVSPCVMAGWHDASGSSSVSSCTYLTTGTAPNRVFTLEFKLWGSFSFSTGYITYQYKLYEGANAIELMYKQENTGGFSSSAAIGIAKSTTDWQSLNNTSASPVSSSTVFTSGLAGARPATGQSYLWGLLKKGMNNASVATLISPSGSFCAGVTLPITVAVKNGGYNRINNVMVNWILDGVPQTPVNWTTLIDTLGSSAGNSANVTLGNVFFGATPHTFKIYTSMPNGVADTVNGDDTISFSLGAALNGVYTVGGTTPDFPNVVAAAAALNQYGVCGPVTFNIRPGTYTGRVQLNTINGASATNRVLFQPEDGNSSSVTINYAATSTGDNSVFYLNGTSYVHLKKLNIAAIGTSYGYALYMTGPVSNDSITSCSISTTNIANTYFGAIYATSLSGTNNNMVFQKNNISGGYYGGLFWNGNSSAYATGMVIEENNIFNVYYYNSYVYYTYGLKFRNNTISGTSTSYYGAYLYYAQQSPVITGNKVNSIYGYGMMIYYTQGVNATNRATIANNVITGGGTTNYGGLYIYGPSNSNIYNNTSYSNGTYATCYTSYFYMNGYSNNSIYNNASINTGGGFAVYMYTLSANNLADYNNWYTSNTSTFGYYNGTTRTDFNAYRSATGGHEKNSLSYNPALSANGMPDPSQSASWAINGRGIQISGNDKDILGNARPTTLAAGVPDIGAYEFEPQSIPPDAVVTPATAIPGSKQYYTFGFDTVAAITWNPQLGITSPLSVKLYSGRKAPAFSAISPNKFMYFYTDITASGSGNTYDFNPDIYYTDNWLGTMPTEANIKLAQKFGSYPWVAYNGTASATNVTRNIISAAGLTSFGAFTGIDTNILSAIVKPKGSTIICNGSYVILKANTSAGYTYQWNKNGTAIPGATADSIMATTPGDYNVTITSGSNAATSIPITVAVVPAPMALVNASGPLTYCTGGNLQLTATTAPGLTYQWQVNGNNINGATNPTYSVTGPGTYTVIVRNIGCGTTSPGAVVTPGPLKVNLGSDTTFCEVKNQPFTINAGYTGAKFAWSTGDTTQSIQIYKGSGSYSVLVDAGPNCVARDTINVVVKPLPNITGINYVSAGNSYTFNTAGAQNAATYLWIFGDGTTSTQQQVAKSFPDGNVIVRLVAFNECGSDTSSMALWATGVNNVNNEGYTLNLYPNPAHQNATVSIDGNASFKDIVLLNSVGQVVYKTEAELNTKSHTIDVSKFASGHYMLRANTTNGVVSKVLNIER